MESVQRLGELVSQIGYPDYQIDSDGDITFLRSYEGTHAIEPSPHHIWTRFNFQFRNDYSVEGTFYGPTENSGLKKYLAHKVARVWLLRKDVGLKVMVAPRIYPHTLTLTRKAHIAVTVSDGELAAWNAKLNQYSLAAERSPAVTVAGGVSWDYVEESLDDLVDRTCYAAGLFMATSITGRLVAGEA